MIRVFGGVSQQDLPLSSGNRKKKENVKSPRGRGCLSLAGHTQRPRRKEFLREVLYNSGETPSSHGRAGGSFFVPHHWIATFPHQDGKVFIFDRYGIVPSVVMRNPNLSIGAKALYAYLMTYVNSEQARSGDVKAWPSRDRMMKELGLSVNTLTKYLRELKDAGLIEVQQARETTETGKTVYSNNIYVIQPYVPAESVSQEFSVTDFVTLKVCDAQNVNQSNTSPSSKTTDPSKTRQDRQPSRRVLSQFEVYMDRLPSPTERRTLARLEREYGTEWVEAAFAEYLVQSDKQEITVPLRYIEGVLKNWRVEGMRLTDILAHLRRLKGERG